LGEVYSIGRTDTILDIPGIQVGQAQDAEALTGVTVLLVVGGATAGADLRGGGSGTREMNLLDTNTTTDQVHGVVLSGGSAFGLDAAGGVMAWLEERGIGFDTGVAKVPLVPQAILFDLGLGDSKVRPDQAMARQACENASADGRLLAQGNAGAGCGATIGKLRQGLGAMKGGIGSASLVLENGFAVGAIVAVNALGDVYEDGRIIAGMLEAAAGAGGAAGSDAAMPPMFADSSRCLLAMGTHAFPATTAPQAGTNTTIGIIATNGAFSKAQCNKISAMAHNGMARAIRPVHTTMDGDLLFTLSTGDMPGSVDVAGEMAAMAVERAIVKAVKAAAPAGGLPSWQSFHPPTANQPL
jgi:L-aminopeptidase/D-esterase-like protein